MITKLIILLLEGCMWGTVGASDTKTQLLIKTRSAVVSPENLCCHADVLKTRMMTSAATEAVSLGPLLVST